MIADDKDTARVRGENGRFKKDLTHDNNFFEMIDSEEKTYWVGFLAGDGYIDKNRPNLGCESADIPHMQLLCQAIGSPAYIKYRDRSESEGYENTKPTATVNVYDQKIVDDLLALEFIQGGNKSKDCSILLDKIPSHLHRHFWRGMYDADGYLEAYANKNKNNPNGISRIELKGSKHHILEVENIWRTHGSKAHASKKNYSTKKHGIREQWYFVTAGNQVCRSFAKWLYDDTTVCLERKYNHAKIMWEKERVHRKFDHLGAEAIRKLIRDCGSIKEAQEELGISRQAMTNLRKRLGLGFRVNKHEFTIDQINSLFDEFGSWEKVATELRISKNSLAGIRKRLNK